MWSVRCGSARSAAFSTRYDYEFCTARMSCFNGNFSSKLGDMLAKLDMLTSAGGITRSRTAEFKRRRPAKLQTSWDGGVCICPCVTVRGAPDTSSTTQPRRSPPLVSGLPPYVSANAQQCSRPRTIALLFRWLGGGEMGGACSASMLFCGEFLG